MENELKTEEWLVGKSLQELKRVAEEVGLKSFAGRQMADWIYKKRVAEVDEMTNLSLEARRRLWEGGIVAGRIDPCEVQVSVDGTKNISSRLDEGDILRRFIFRTGSGRRCASRRRRGAGWGVGSV